MHHTYFRTVLDEDVLLDADLLPDFLFKHQVLLYLVQEHFALANIVTIEGLLSNSLKPIVRSSVRPSVHLAVCLSGKIIFWPKGLYPSAGARKKPPVGGLTF